MLRVMQHIKKHNFSFFGGGVEDWDSLCDRPGCPGTQ